jgi:hypothetical protein
MCLRGVSPERTQVLCARLALFEDSRRGAHCTIKCSAGKPVAAIDVTMPRWAPQRSAVQRKRQLAAGHWRRHSAVKRWRTRKSLTSSKDSHCCKLA